MVDGIGPPGRGIGLPRPAPELLLVSLSGGHGARSRQRPDLDQNRQHVHHVPVLGHAAVSDQVDIDPLDRDALARILVLVTGEKVLGSG